MILNWGDRSLNPTRYKRLVLVIKHCSWWRSLDVNLVWGAQHWFYVNKSLTWGHIKLRFPLTSLCFRLSFLSQAGGRKQEDVSVNTAPRSTLWHNERAAGNVGLRGLKMLEEAQIFLDLQLRINPLFTRNILICSPELSYVTSASSNKWKSISGFICQFN